MNHLYYSMQVSRNIYMNPTLVTKASSEFHGIRNLRNNIESCEKSQSKLRLSEKQYFHMNVTLRQTPEGEDELASPQQIIGRERVGSKNTKDIFHTCLSL